MKRRVTLSGNRMKTKASLHTYVARKLKLPDYYGNNLDALHDCLSERATPLHVTVTYTERLKENLGSYGDTFLQVLQDTAEENQLISISVYAGKRT
ncbi:MAG: barstar family protein [Lachnospiraceae bacterium]|nr:barstar family protein [Lachnospiraceae bacterium]